MESRFRNVTALGAMVLVAGALFVWGLYFLLGEPLLGGGTEIVAVLDDGAGLKRGDRVQLRGVQVGSVREVHLEEVGGVAVLIRLTENLSLPADTRVSVRSDVFGANVMDLRPGQAVLPLESGDTLTGVASPGLSQMMADLGGQASGLLSQADSLLSPQAVADVHETTAVLPASVEALRSVFVELEGVAGSLRRSAQSLEEAEAGPALGRALNEVETSARALTDAAGEIEQSFGSLASVLAKIDEGNGTLGQLVNDPALYQELHHAVSEMRALAADVRAQPERYVTFRVF